jgi:hypothetical protein
LQKQQCLPGEEDPAGIVYECPGMGGGYAGHMIGGFTGGGVRTRRILKPSEVSLDFVKSNIINRKFIVQRKNCMAAMHHTHYSARRFMQEAGGNPIAMQ